MHGVRQASSAVLTSTIASARRKLAIQATAMARPREESASVGPDSVLASVLTGRVVDTGEASCWTAAPSARFSCF